MNQCACGKPAAEGKRGMCHACYMQWYRTGSTERPGYKERTCDECGEKHYAKGKCIKHYNLWRAENNLGPWRREKAK